MSRHLMAKMRRTADGGKPRSTDDVIKHVRDNLGIHLTMDNTGGGCYVLAGRLDDGSWIRAADHNDFCYPELRDRHEEEKRDGPLGWDVDIYPNEHEEAGSSPDGKLTWGPSDYWGGDPIHSHSDPDAHVHELSRVIQDAFASMPSDAKDRHRERERQDSINRGFDPDQAPAKSIPDYENLVNPKTDLGDEDYGDIFGKQSRRLAQMSYEDTMRHIDEALAAGEPEDESDYSTDYSVNHRDGIDTEEDRLAEQARRNQEEDDTTDRLWNQWMGELTGKHHRWLEEVNGKAMDDDFAAYHDHHVHGTPYTMTPVPEHELERQRRSLEGR